MAAQQTGQDSLLGFLRDTKKAADSGAFDVDKMKKDWLAEVATLMTTLREFLKPAEEQGLLKVEPFEEFIREERLGDYKAEGLRIIAPNQREVRVHVRGRHIVGAMGRVDLGSGPKTAMLVQPAPGKWLLRWSPQGSRELVSPPVPLDSNAFSEALLNLLS